MLMPISYPIISIMVMPSALCECCLTFYKWESGGPRELAGIIDLGCP